jgi:predicted hydrocarbon binding protein
VTGADIGRVLVASLHQAIADELPTRVDFYDHWLNGDKLRDGGMGLAPMSAVLGFLRAEGDAYARVMRRAGEYTADWTIEALPSFQRQTLSALPRWWRVRRVLRLGVRTIRDGYAPTVVNVRVDKTEARVELKDSLFCRVRERHAAPLCEYYAALIAELLTRFDLPCRSSIESCAGTRDAACGIRVHMDTAVLPAPPPEEHAA